MNLLRRFPRPHTRVEEVADVPSYCGRPRWFAGVAARPRSGHELGASDQGGTLPRLRRGLPRYPAALDEIEDEERTAYKFFQDVQREAAGSVNAAGLVAHCEIRPGHAAQALPHYAMEVGAELLVIGHSGHSGIWGRLLGTTADKVVEHAPCSVLVVR
ncbi:MAG TPA: universal stress protein [Candidatus Binatia bacterium]|nr:universal stress protein [Candidatus Binatia bacterium]